MAKKESALGKGLGALLGDASKVEQAREMVRGVSEININDIEVNPYQPRVYFDEVALDELAESIKKHGIIQPITVRESNNHKYQIISGERRFRASKLAGLRTIPAYVRHTNDQDMLELALIENIQREDLDAIEVATSFNRLIEECELTQDALGDRVGKKRATITNYLRLLKLPAEIQLYIRDKKMSMGQARAILNIENKKQQARLAKKIVDEGLSVRQVEDAVRKLGQEKPADKKKENIIFPEKYNKINQSIGKYFNNNVSVKPNAKGGGRITINFANDAEIDEFLKKLEE